MGQFARRALLTMAGLVMVAGTAYSQQGGGAGGATPLTNADVSDMVKGGVPEAAILSVIRLQPTAFDVSANARTAFFRNLAGTPSHETNDVWNAMAAKSGAHGQGPAAAGAPATGRAAGKPGKLTAAQIAALTAKVHGTKGTLGPVASNPAAADTAMLGVLRQQKLVALNERGQTGARAGPAPTAAAGRTGMAAMIRAPHAAIPPPPPPSRSNRTAVTGTNIALSCATFSTPSIVSISGQQGGAVFTQDPAYNPFTIKGCNFGNVRGLAQLNSGRGTKLASLVIDGWTDSLITVEVDPMLTDALDDENVTLVLFPASGPQTTKSSLRFHAERGEIRLTSIPASAVSLVPINDDSGAPVSAKFSSPYSYSGGGASGGVDRVNMVRFPGGTDAFDFSKLKPGFVIEKWQASELSRAQCDEAGPTSTTFYTDGNWAWQLTGTTLSVTWQESHCHDAMFGDGSDASYGLTVWVLGPVLGSGASPWQAGAR